MRATRRLAIFLKPYWHWAVLAPLLMVLEVAMDLMQPRLIQQIVDQGIARSDLSTVYTTGLLMIACAMAGLIGGAGCTIYAVLAAQGFGADLRGTLFRKVQAFSFANLDQLETGKLITRLTNDVTQVQEVVMILLRIMVRVPLLLIGSLVMGVLTSPRLALLFVALIPVILIGLIWVIRKTFPMYSQVQRLLDGVNTVMQENLAGVRVVKAFARAGHEIARFRHANRQLTDQNILAVQTSAVTMPMMMLLVNLGIVGAVWFGGIQVSTGDLRVGELIAFVNYLMQALMSLMMVSMLAVRISRAEASAERIFEVLDTEPTVRSRPGALSSFAPVGRVAFENVSFSYQGDERDPALTSISLVAEPGQTIALLGATGSGKSSLVNLIPRFYDVTSGRVTIDGIDVRELDEATLRRAIGIVPQEAVLFSGTIRDNIRYGRPDASDAEVIASARLAQAHEFIGGFPEGYDSRIGQRGVNLSGGQKQRLAIARAALTQPAILILDDSTSAIDVATEARLQAALAAWPRGQTRFIVAQRISSVRSADCIVVLDDGSIAGIGTHEELLNTSSIYREIYASQAEGGVLIHGGE